MGDIDSCKCHVHSPFGEDGIPEGVFFNGYPPEIAGVSSSGRGMVGWSTATLSGLLSQLPILTDFDLPSIHVTATTTTSGTRCAPTGQKS